MSNRKAVGGDKIVAVAIDKDKASQHALKWAIDRSLPKTQIITLIHVLNISAVEQKDIFLPFRIYCTRRDVQCDVVTLHDNDIAKALIDYVLLHRVDTLVLGSPSRSISRLFSKNDIPSVVLKGTPDFCNVYVISKGKISSGRKATRPLRHRHISADDKVKSFSRSETSLTNFKTREKPMQNRMSVCTDAYVPDPDIGFESSGRLSTDITLFSFDDYPTTDSTPGAEISPPPPKSASGESRTMSEPSHLSYSESFDLNPSSQVVPNQLNAVAAQQIEEMERKLKRLELELKQTMEMYHSACKVALKEKEKAKEIQLLRVKDEKTIEEAIKAKEEALEMAEREKALCREAMDAAKAAEKIALRESERRIIAERKALKEAVAKKLFLVTNFGHGRLNNDTISKQKSLVHILVVVFIFFLYIIALIC